MPTPNPRVLAQRANTACTRYSREGIRCRQPAAADGWCGTCAGFTTPAPQPPAFGRRYYTTKVNSNPCPLGLEAVATIGITHTVIAQYLTAHPGSDPDQADAAIRAMVEDLLTHRRWRADPGGWLVLAHEGFFATISPDRAAVVTYRTSHIERTWGQVQANVPSRLKAARRRRYVKRRLERRNVALDNAGITCTTHTSEGTRSLVLTGPDGRTLTIEGRALRDLSVAQWRELVDHVRAELGLTLDPLKSHSPQEPR
ncbi:hypothetical protein ACWFMI_23840 [Nocardiopsis terrae]|uniref:hypothetical protein n=1 Tax=Streptomyces sp. NPDC057554 TaxID=3350538 RepID=UPI0036A96CCF